MTALVEKLGAGGFVVSEANNTRSREAITVKSGEVLYAGQVLGKITVGAATPAAVAGNTGDGVVGAVTLSAGAKAGVYRGIFIEPTTDLGTFEVEDPDGVIIGSGVVGTAFTHGGLSFTIADGAADFKTGDQFTITVALATPKYVGLDTSAADGSQVAAGILFASVDASGGDTAGVAIVRDSEYNNAEVDFITVNAGEITTAKAQLTALGIIERTGI